MLCHDKGVKSVLGEIVVPVEDVLAECHSKHDEKFSCTYEICKVGTKKPVTWKSSGMDGNPMLRKATLDLQFRFSTKQSQRKVMPSKMLETVVSQIRDEESSLIQTSFILGPSFQDVDGSWDTVDIYLSSNLDDMHAEREFLNRYVFPALAIKCLDLRLRLQWKDLSSSMVHGNRDDIIQRLETLLSCSVRNFDSRARKMKQCLMVSLIGEKRGRIVDSRDIRRLERSSLLQHGDFSKMMEAVRKGVSVQELETRCGQVPPLCPSSDAPAGLYGEFNELRGWTFERPNDSLICIRDNAFLSGPEFQAQVPPQVREYFLERDETDMGKNHKFKSFLNKTASPNVVHYSPRFHSYALNQDASATAARKSCKHVSLVGMEEFGMTVFSRLWNVLRQRFPCSRSKVAVNRLLTEQARQEQIVMSYVQPLVFADNGSQVQTLRRLFHCLFLQGVLVSYLTGEHGSGKSSLLAKFVQVLKPSAFKSHLAADAKEEKRPSKLQSATLGIVAAMNFSLSKNRPGTPEMVKQVLTNLNVGSERELRMHDDSQPPAEVLLKNDDDILSRVVQQDFAIFDEQNFKMIYFFKMVHFLSSSLSPPLRRLQVWHTTKDVLSYLCSAVLDEQDIFPASWNRLEVAADSHQGVSERPARRSCETGLRSLRGIETSPP